MARSRNIKPGIFKNEVLGVADPIYTLLFEGLWLLADREGRLEDRPLRIRGEIFPYREGLDMGAMLDWLQAHEFIRRYRVNGRGYIWIVTFKEHQNPHKNEPESALPSIDDADASPEEIGTTSEKIGSARACISDSGFSDSGFLESSTSAKPPSRRPASKPEVPEEFEAAWGEYPARPGNSKQEALKAWSARVKAGVSPQVMLDGVRRYAAFCEAQRTEAQFIKLASTFFGPSEHYLSDWAPQAARASPGPNRQEAIEARNRAVGEEWLKQEGFTQ